MAYGKATVETAHSGGDAIGSTEKHTESGNGTTGIYMTKLTISVSSDHTH